MVDLYERGIKSLEAKAADEIEATKYLKETQMFLEEDTCPSKVSRRSQ